MQRTNAFGLEVIVNGRPLPVIEHGGKTYIAAPWTRTSSCVSTFRSARAATWR